jgi:xanthine dehydrogenase molybdopterin-binding subunit B
VQIIRYNGVNDFGTVVNPMIVAGQIHGGVAQGIGQALMECVTYDDSGQPVTGSFMDYALPRAGDIPSMTLSNHPRLQPRIRSAPRDAAKQVAREASLASSMRFSMHYPMKA